MIRLFVQTVVFLVLVLAAAFWIQSKVFDHLIVQSQKQNRIDFRQRFAPIFHFVEFELSKVSQEEWPAVLEKHRSGFPLPGTLVDLNELAASLGSPNIGNRLRQGQIAGWDDGGAHIFTAKQMGESGKVFLLKYPNPPSVRSQSAYWGFAIEFALLTLVVAGLTLLLWRDVIKLTAASEKIGRGVYDFDLNVGRASALWPIAASFNAMRDRVAAHVSAQRELIHSISHEFRTPLARIRFRQELIRSAATAEERCTQLDLMENSIDELDELASEILEYSRLDSGYPDMQVEEISCLHWLGEIVAEEPPPSLAGSPPCSIELDVSAATLVGDPKFLRRAVSNLLRNAYRHANHRVRIVARQAGQRTTVVVEDDGPGIPPEHWKRIFDPFARVDDSRGRHSGGFGIGLAIVRQIAKMHGGNVLIGAADSGGASVGFWIPSAQPAPTQ